MATASVLAAAVVTVPHAIAALAPPPGRAFAGNFHWIDDVYNYASFVQQAEDGALRFENKLDLDDHGRVLVNVEWTAVGWMSRLAGRRPFLAYRILAVVALAALLNASDRAMRRAGLPASHRLPGLLLVAFGGGLGGLLFELTERSVFRSADLYVGYYPFLEALGNPHWLLATWLLLESLLAFGAVGDPPSAAASARAALVGTILGLVRPYDLVLLAAVHAVTVLATGRPAGRLRRLLPLAGLAPVALYNYWAFFVSPAFRTYVGTAYQSPPAADVLWALGPAALLALVGAPGRSAGDGVLRAQLWAWAAIAVFVVALEPVTFALQFAVGAGLPLLVLGALALPRLRPLAAALVAVLFSTTAVTATRIVLRPDPNWHVPAERIEAARLLRPACRPGQVVFAPPDVGLYALAFASCRPFVSHSWEPGHDLRAAAAAAFYGGLDPATRAAVLDRVRARHLVLPGDPGPAPVAWLGPATAFRKRAQSGTGERALSIYSR